MGALRIATVEARALRLPMEVPISSSLGTDTHVDCTVVHVHTEDGPTGTGLTACLGGHSSSAIVPYIRNELAPLAVGQNALAPEALWNRLWAPNKARLSGGIGTWARTTTSVRGFARYATNRPASLERRHVPVLCCAHSTVGVERVPGDCGSHV
jgi:hypothetical protein